MRPGLFQPGQFDVICLFQVFDHIPDPAALLHECFRVLRPGGFILAINHNVSALSARLLRERSPIIDIEHTYLYAPATMSRLFSAHGFEVRRVGIVRNRYSLQYLTQLLPLPPAAKRVALVWSKRLAIGQLRLWLALGNLYLVAQKSGQSSGPGADASSSSADDDRRKNGARTAESARSERDASQARTRRSALRLLRLCRVAKCAG
jgi:SAM-dependent methyltransferase